MLAGVESLLDTGPGTLLLITHDRYLMERVTDDQFAIVDGKIRHVPGGVDEYLRLLDARSDARAAAKAVKPKAEDVAPDAKAEPTLSRSEEYTLKKELASTERKLATAEKKADKVRAELHEVDPSDYVALGDVQKRIHEAEKQVADLEDEWMQLSERLS